MTITKRTTKGSALTYAELDENFRDLDEDMTLERIIENDYAKSAGTVLQVKHATQGGVAAYNTGSGTNNSASTGLSVTITPKYADSEIYIDFSVFLGQSHYQAKLYLVRAVGTHTANAGTHTTIGTGNEFNGRPRSTATVIPYDDTAATNDYQLTNLTNFIVDRPNTTDTVTYYLKMACLSGETVYLNRSRVFSNGTTAGYDAVPSSNLRVMEVATDHTSVTSLTHVASSFVEMPSSASQTRQIQIPSTAQAGDIAVLWGWFDANAISAENTNYEVNDPASWALAVGTSQTEDARLFGYIHGSSWVKILNEDEVGFNMTLTAQASGYMSACIAVFRPDKPISEFYIKNGNYFSSSAAFSRTMDKTSVIPVSALVVGLGGRYSGQNPVLTGTDITIVNSSGSVGDPKYGYKIYNDAATLNNQTFTTTDAGRQAMNAFYLEVV